jgi:hypothetical protein
MFKAEISWWGDDYKSNNNPIPFSPQLSDLNSFKKPVSIQDIQISNNTGTLLCSSSYDWNAEPDIWKEQKYKIILNNSWSVSVSDWKLGLSVATIRDVSEGHIWLDNKIWNINDTFSDFDACLWFTWTIDVYDNALSGLEIKNQNLPISYTLGGKSVSFYLDEFSKKWKCENKSTLWVKVLWTLQSDWKASSTWQEENFSDLSTWEMRWIIRKNANLLIRNMTSWQIANGVKYVVWDVKISEVMPWWVVPNNIETLIVKDWNVIIDVPELNKISSKLWIIVLKDNYDVNSDYNKSWNIYVNNNVKKINAIIYADWTLRSARANWTSYEDGDILIPLELFWSLFTRNTIWWATKIWWDYLLPWGQKITDFNSAQRYDLNYVRKTPLCNLEDYAFKIEYDSKVQTNPPKGFSR